MYRVGYPFWKAVARRGFPVLVRVNIHRDDEAGVFIGTSPDLDGFVVEGKSLDDLLSVSPALAQELVDLAIHADRPIQPVTDFRFRNGAHCAA